MIKFMGIERLTNKPIYGLGLSERNIEMLTQGKPIAVDLASMNPGKAEGQVFIFYGLNEQTMYDELKDQGLVNATVSIGEQKQLHEGPHGG